MASRRVLERSQPLHQPTSLEIQWLDDKLLAVTFLEGIRCSSILCCQHSRDGEGAGVYDLCNNFALLARVLGRDIT